MSLRRPIDSLATLRLFRLIAEQGSFSRAAERLELSSGAASKQISALEASLGVRLLQRSTRRLSLTEAGRLYYHHCVKALDELELAEQALQALGDTPRGRLRVAVPIAFGQLFLQQHLPGFLRAYPEVALDLVLSDHYVDLVEDGFDLALRISSGLPDSRLVARTIGPLGRALVASPGYLAAAGPLAHPSDLGQHATLIHTLSGGYAEWSFQRGDEEVRVPVRGRLSVNSSMLLRTSLLDGLGLTLTPTLAVQDLLADGRLVEVLPDWAPQGLKLFALLPSNRAVAPKTAAFIEFLSRLALP
ncbi:LysR substrate-binding domain-containing protein [Neisseriaceae bacterium JH1-16]|nr:LysR substrate-binding domain-containing protein [Neisseriaceae bacterium JH1-16]